MSTILATDNYRVQRAQDFIRDFANNDYYLFFGDGSLHTSNNILDVNDDIEGTLYQVWNNMICGKEITTNNVVLAIKNIPYQSNTVYTMYDDSDPNLSTENYYVIVNAGSWYHTFKCLDNNANTLSVIQPDFSQIVGTNVTLYQTGDGYRWKYMYSVPVALVDAFGYSDYFPYQANNDISGNAVPGSIDVIHVDYGGNYYNNYYSGNFRTADIAIGSEVIYALSSDTAATANGYYTGCIIYMTTGLSAGEYHFITDYVSNTLGNFIILDVGFTDVPQNGDSFEIYPQVYILGSGQQTVNCVGRALINSLATNSIYRVDILNRGADYNMASATAVCNAVVKNDTGANTAILRPILPPSGGHGANGAVELQAYNVIVGQNFSNNEFDTIVDSGGYQQIGLVRNPLFANVQVNLLSATSEFVSTEEILNINPYYIQSNCFCSADLFFIGSPTNTSLFTTQFSPGDVIFFYDPGLVQAQLTTVVSVVNNQVLEISAPANFSSNNLLLAFANAATKLICNTVVSTSEILAETDSNIQTGSLLMGTLTNNLAYINNIERNGVIKTFSTYIQATQLGIVPLAGSFIDGEIISQGLGFAVLQSISANGTTAWVTSPGGIPLTTSTITGLQSGATAQVSSILPGELVYGSGDIIYLENIDLITRSNTQSETFKLTFQF